MKPGIRIRSSIFLKFTLVVLFFGVLLNLSVLIVLKYSTAFQFRKDVPGLMLKMERAMIYEMGVPPDTVKARNICEDMEVNIRFQSRELNWASSDAVPAIEELITFPEFMQRFSHMHHFVYFHDSRPYSIFKTPKGVFIIQQLNPVDFFNPERGIIILVVLVTVILVLLYFILRMLLRPLKQLSGAVKLIGEGNYDVTVPSKRSDELGDLADSINEMSRKIKDAMIAKQQLLLDVSHELRTPLTRIKLGLEVGSPKEKINEDVGEMESMITGLLESYRSGNTYAKLDLRETDVVKLLNDTISEFNEPERINFRSGGQNIALRLDSMSMQKVFRNLIDNALKYSAGIVSISVNDASDGADIVFKDNGPGISEEDRKYIFEPFYRADRSRSKKTGGFGLGLSICKRIIEAHNGKITINSEPDKGTEVIVTLLK